MAEQIIIEITNQCSTQEFELFELFELDENTFDEIEVLIADYDDDVSDDEIQKTLKKFRCIIRSIGEVVNGNKIVEVYTQWEVTQKYLEVLFNRMNACKHIENKKEQTE